MTLCRLLLMTILSLFNRKMWKSLNHNTKSKVKYCSESWTWPHLADKRSGQGPTWPNRRDVTACYTTETESETMVCHGMCLSTKIFGTVTTLCSIKSGYVILYVQCARVFLKIRYRGLLQRRLCSIALNRQIDLIFWSGLNRQSQSLTNFFSVTITPSWPCDIMGGMWICGSAHLACH